MANSTFENRMIRTHRIRARDWLLGWAEQHADEFSSVNEPNCRLLLDLYLPNGRQVVFDAPMDEEVARLFMLCSLGSNAPVWRHACPAQLLNWLCEGMTVPPTQVFYSHAQNFLVVALPLQLQDWGQAMEVTLPMVSIVLAYLSRVRAYVAEANSLSSLECRDAVLLRQWFQDEMRAYPILTDLADPEALIRLSQRRLS